MIIDNTIRITAAYPRVHIANPLQNSKEILNLIERHKDSDILVLPELCVTGYTCGDLFGQSVLHDDAMEALYDIYMQNTHKGLVVVGMPLRFNSALYNCAVVLSDAGILGVVPKSFLPNYKEFYEKRWFRRASSNDPRHIRLFDHEVPFGTDLLFRDPERKDCVVGIEICEDVWAPIPPSSFQALSGATILLNLSASDETVAKSEYRRAMLEQHSGRLLAAYVYCSSGPTESTSDLVFGGHCLITENGHTLVETEKFKDEDSVTSDVDIERIGNERRANGTFADSQDLVTFDFRIIDFVTDCDMHKSKPIYKVNPLPFVPSNAVTLKRRCEEIFNIQVCGLAKRLEAVRNSKLTIGISGGLDSTLAALVLNKAIQRVRLKPDCVDAITMPGFGTSSHTLENSNKLMRLLGFSATKIDICDMAYQAMLDMDHSPFGIKLKDKDHLDRVLTLMSQLSQVKDAKDVVFENIQARLRTFILMSRGFVIGTGDLSEGALGWCTYNGDHMSMYNVNCSIPKTLVKFLVKYVAENEVENEELKNTLLSIVDTVISPELLPLGEDGKITQSTEDIIGPYELHDFFLFQMLRNGFPPSKIIDLATLAFMGVYSKETIKKWMKVFIERFFRNQFKRDCVPNGPKVGSISLSPRGDWRMPSDASLMAWDR